MFFRVLPRVLSDSATREVERYWRVLVSAEAPERLLWFPMVANEGPRLRSNEGVSAEIVAISDEDLLARAQAGDTQAVGILFDRYSKLVLSIGRRILRDRGEAEDLVQEVFLRLCGKANTFDADKGSARTWMVQFVYRRALDRRTYLQRRFFYSGTDLEALKNACQEGSRPDEQIVARLTGTHLRAAFTELKEKERATIRMYFFEGYDLREIAEELGESFENARHYYYRGLERLKRTAIAMALRNQK